MSNEEPLNHSYLEITLKLAEPTSASVRWLLELLIIYFVNTAWYSENFIKLKILFEFFIFEKKYVRKSIEIPIQTTLRP